MATSRIALDTTQYVRVNFGFNPMVIEANEGEIRVAVTENQPAVTNLAFHRVTDRQRLELDSVDANVWVLALSKNQKAVVTEMPDPSGDASVTNTTTTPLAGGATFTGIAELNNYSDVGVSCHTDAAGTLYFDFSNDATNWNTFPTNGFDISAGIHEFHTAVKLGRYFRVRLVNGAAAQTYLRLYTYYGQYRLPSAPMNQPLGLDSDAILTRPSWTWLDIGRGLSSGVQSVKKFGRNASVGTNFVPVCLGGVYQVPQSSAATTLRIKAGGDANDTAAGSGARSVTIAGLDENFNEVSETIATNGTLASASTTTTFTRVYRCFVAESGSYATATQASHGGQITIENTAGTQDWAVIDNGDFPKAQSEIGAFTIPAGKKGFVKLRDLSIDSGKTVDMVFFSRTNADQTAPPYAAMRAQSVVSGVAGGSIESFGDTDVPFGPYIGPTDVGFMAKVTAGTASVSVEFEIILVSE